VKLVSNRRETPTSRTIRISLGGRPFPYKAGQAALVGLSAGDELTPYSIASAPEETAREGWLQFLVKVDAARRFGAAVERIPRGADIHVHGPLGNFTFPDSPAQHEFLFVAGGTGIAPVRSMLIHALATVRAPVIRLLYSARRPDEFAYVRELRALEREGRISLELTLTGETGRWRHGRGRAGAAHLHRLGAGPHTMAFVYGPSAMVTDLTSALASLGVPSPNIHTEQR
jgi:sulfhydrogenase subunit gamma (sulfur reductase)